MMNTLTRLPHSSQSSPATAQPTPPATAQPTAATRIRLRPDERWFLLGKTRSGKSTLARFLLEEWSRKGWRVVIAGPKGDWPRHPAGWERSGVGTVDKPRLVDRFYPKLAVQYFKVTIPGWRDEAFSQFCIEVLHAGHTVFLLDDIDGVATANQSAPGLSQLWTEGGAQHVPAIACHQWTTSLPRVMKGQAENWAVFRMTDPEDMDLAARYTNTPEMRAPSKGGLNLPKYWWWYWNVDYDNGARLMQPIRRGA